MGCKLTKLAASEFNHDAIDRPPPPSDPRSPLTTKQQYCMLASWKGIFREIEKTGILLFIKLFEENEDLLHLFDDFMELHMSKSLAQSEELAEHATKEHHTSTSDLMQDDQERTKNKTRRRPDCEKEANGFRVMHTLDESIKGLGDVDTFFAYIRHVGATHHQVDGFKAENFWKIEQPFLQAAKTTLGDRYTPNIENIYKMTIKFILENLVKGYEEAEKVNGQT